MKYLLLLLLAVPVWAGWVSPTSKEDDQWTDSELMYDGNTVTFGWNSTNGRAVTLLIASTSCSKIRIYAGRAAGGSADLDIDVYYSGGWHAIHDGPLAEDTWVEISVGSTEDITKAKITAGDGIESQVGEFEFWDEGAAAPDSTHLGGSGSDTLKIGGTAANCTTKIGI